MPHRLYFGRRVAGWQKTEPACNRVTLFGKVIRLTAGHQARVEEKPEIKKAGGVKYTPVYIVNYIVRNTLGKWIEANIEQPTNNTLSNSPSAPSTSPTLPTKPVTTEW